ncbi:DUF4389 domain-containing protein [Sedimenticola hydrogenitrophicus]|uniref:DUF4389 domain-containing protein n=1 Tax=Sedimenticola hydrogenitrophicus TaxID=2967975 RepID=UPI0021A7A625|nr:DUF4389 domain-containing protein [Sedimenticola hydrogenitrophicus]
MNQEEKPATNPIWIRGLYMLLFILIHGIAKGVAIAVSVIQFILVVINKAANQPLCKFGQGLSTYLYDITQFLVFNTEHKPFPFDDWRNAPPREESPASDQDMEYQSGQ